MKKLNNKGVTLVELIVAFALVSVAILYFYQTLYTVNRLYGVTRRETANYVDVNYVYRLLDQKVINSINDTTQTDTSRLCNQGIIYSKISDYLGTTKDDILKKYTILECSKVGSRLDIKFADDKGNKYWYTKYVDSYAFNDGSGSEPAPKIEYKMVKANGVDPATKNITSGWYYDTSPTLKVTVDKNGGPDIKKVERCENNNCTDITSKLVNNVYTEANLPDTTGKTVVFKATNIKGKETELEISYKIDTVAPVVTANAASSPNGNNGWYTSSKVNFSASASDSTSGIDKYEYYWNLAYNTDTKVDNSINSTWDATNRIYSGAPNTSHKTINYYGAYNASTSDYFAASGTRRAKFIFTDVAGNESSKELTIKIDNIASISFDTAGLGTSKYPYSTYTWSGNTSSIVMRFSGAAQSWDPILINCGPSGCANSDGHQFQVKGCATQGTAESEWRHKDWSYIFLQSTCNSGSSNCEKANSSDSNNTKSMFKYNYRVCNNAGLCSGTITSKSYYNGHNENWDCTMHN